eukprot:CAMPEP_0178983502 /NCGR_PEP_ID=MMETSP0795-20121207/1096_1 /TAXON_ID=88552 /ORGANISM="Amoebophrya sp., Strain Ameob2" /LENGTH=268 /DNA_ID=CAMNT_0020674283 /DNA_START=1251 /DNA_END=2054 /DNA_ORIENTATION=-
MSCRTIWEEPHLVIRRRDGNHGIPLVSYYERILESYAKILPRLCQVENCPASEGGTTVYDFYEYQFLYASEMHRRQMDSQSQLRQKSVVGAMSPILSRSAAMSPRGVGDLQASSSVRSVETSATERPTVGAGGTRSILPTTPENGFYASKMNSDHVDGVDHVVVTLAGLSETEIAEGCGDVDGTSKATAEEEVGGNIKSCSLATSATSKWNNSPAAADTDMSNDANMKDALAEILLDRRRQEALAVVTSLHKTLQNDAVGIAAELLQC